MRLFRCAFLILLVIALLVLSVPPARSDVTQVNVIDPDSTIIDEYSSSVFILGCEIVNDASGVDMLEALTVTAYNETPFAAASYKLWHQSQGTGVPVLKRTVATAGLPLAHGAQIAISNLNLPVPAGNVDTLLITMSVLTDTVINHRQEFDGTGVQLCILQGNMDFSSGSGQFPTYDLCPSGFDPGPPASGYLIVFDTWPPHCGDANGDATINIADAIYLFASVFSAGPAPVDRNGGNVNCDGRVNITDASYLVRYILGGGPAPCAACP